MSAHRDSTRVDINSFNQYSVYCSLFREVICWSRSYRVAMTLCQIVWSISTMGSSRSALKSKLMCSTILDVSCPKRHPGKNAVTQYWGGIPLKYAAANVLIWWSADILCSNNCWVWERAIFQKRLDNVRENFVVKFSFRWKQQYTQDIQAGSKASASNRPLSRSLMNIEGRIDKTGRANNRCVKKYRHESTLSLSTIAHARTKIWLFASRVTASSRIWWKRVLIKVLSIVINGRQYVKEVLDSYGHIKMRWNCPVLISCCRWI